MNYETFIISITKIYIKKNNYDYINNNSNNK